MKFEGVTPNVHIYNSVISVSVFARPAVLSFSRQHSNVRHITRRHVVRMNKDACALFIITVERCVGDMLTFCLLTARCDLWEKGFELFKEMDAARVQKDVVTYNSVLDAVSSQISLGRDLFKEGVEKGFYSQVSKVGRTSCELALHFLSLGGGEIACR